MGKRTVQVIFLGVLTALIAAAPACAASRVTRLKVNGRQALSGGYERVSGVVRGVVAGSERGRIAGLPAAGLRYAVQFELIRPAQGSPRSRTVLVEAENRGSPLLLDALLSLDPLVAGPPAAARYQSGTAKGFLRGQGLSYARVQWQTGIAADVPESAQGAGEAIVRDFGRRLARRYPRRVLAGVSQGAFFVDTFIAEGFNRDPESTRGVYQDALTVDGAGNWMAINQLARGGTQVPYLRPNGRPLRPRRLLRRPRSDPFLVDVAAYTDFYRLRAGLTDRDELPGRMVRYDWPAAHQQFGPEAIFASCNGRVRIGLNLIDYHPYLRALVAGLLDRRLPLSRRFELGPTPATSATFNGLPGVPVPVPRVDADGQPRGGVRFPEVSHPLGRLQPVSIPPVSTKSISDVCGNSGGFDPFPATAVTSRYGSPASYRTLYARSLRRLRQQGLLLAADRRAMLRAATVAYRAATG